MKHKTIGWMFGLMIGLVGTYLYAQLYSVPFVALVLAICATLAFASLIGWRELSDSAKSRTSDDPSFYATVITLAVIAAALLYVMFSVPS